MCLMSDVLATGSKPSLYNEKLAKAAYFYLFVQRLLVLKNSRQVILVIGNATGRNGDSEFTDNTSLLLLRFINILLLYTQWQKAVDFIAGIYYTDEAVSPSESKVKAICMTQKGKPNVFIFFRFVFIGVLIFVCCETLL